MTIWIAAVMFKSNDILKKQTALKVCIMDLELGWARAGAQDILVGLFDISQSEL